MSETPADNPENNVDSAEEQQMHVASRREKMRKIEELGLDPWGSRFDDRLLISEIRARVGEVQYQKEDGTLVDLPELDVDPEQRVNMREWRAEQGPGPCLCWLGTGSRSLPGARRHRHRSFL